VKVNFNAPGPAEDATGWEGFAGAPTTTAPDGAETRP
jgi:hypothetical protein